MQNEQENRGAYSEVSRENKGFGIRFSSMRPFYVGYAIGIYRIVVQDLTALKEEGPTVATVLAYEAGVNEGLRQAKGEKVEIEMLCPNCGHVTLPFKVNRPDKPYGQISE